MPSFRKSLTTVSLVMLTTIAAHPAQSASETFLHAFDGADGSNPQSGLTAESGKLFGTTIVGGGDTGCLNQGCGVVFSLKSNGSGEQTLHTFTGATDGGNPVGSLVAVQGSLYGVASGGGDSTNCPSGCGTVFEITKDGSFSVVYTFGGGPGDGASPLAGLLYANGLLYGTTSGGGSHEHGTVFSLTLSGQETVLHSFSQGDGSHPAAGLIKVGSLFYGTTANGGKYKHGNVFSMNDKGKTKNVYAFQGGNDGSGPLNALVVLNGVLYGTTQKGGPSGVGTVFSLTPQGQEAVITSFTSTHSYPSSGLTVVDGSLYGTTFGGGLGDAVIYSVTPQGEFSIVFDFGPSPIVEADRLLYKNGMFFGAVTEDGPPNNDGAIYSVTP